MTDGKTQPPEGYIDPAFGVGNKQIKEDIEFAFPYSDPSKAGMTITDYFAGCALIGILSAHSKTTLDKALSTKAGFRELAKQAYDFADQMKLERNSPSIQ